MKISYISLFPDLIKNYLSEALLGKAQLNEIMSFDFYNIRDYAVNHYKSIDDTIYGGSDGALIQYEPLKKALDNVPRLEKNLVIYLSPQGQKIDKKLILDLKKQDQLILISGRYAGIDERFIVHHVDLEISVGDYVLSGGELPSLVLTEVLSREIDGVLGNKKSVLEDSFSSGLLEAPQFTKPSEVDGHKVPQVLLSGDHLKIKEWNKNLSILVTLKKRIDLINQLLDKKEIVIDWKQLSLFYSELSNIEKNNLRVSDLEITIDNYNKQDFK